MKASATTNNGRRDSESHTPIAKAIAWLCDYAHAHPYTQARRKRESSSTSYESFATVQLWTNCSRFSRKSQRLIKACRKYTEQKRRSSNINMDLARRHKSKKYSQNQARQNRTSGGQRILTRPSPTSATITNDGEDVTVVTRAA
jgi:hypothetical protein